MRVGFREGSLTRSDEELEEGQRKRRAGERPPPLWTLSEICSLTGWSRERREVEGGGGGIEQVEAWGERKVNRSGR